MALLAIALSAAAGAAVSARVWLTPQPAAMLEPLKAKSQGGDVRDDPPPLPADVTLTTLNALGFSPSEIAHEAGRFRIVVRNKSGEATPDLRLDGEGSSRFAERHALGELQRWSWRPGRTRSPTRVTRSGSAASPSTERPRDSLFSLNKSYVIWGQS